MYTILEGQLCTDNNPKQIIDAFRHNFNVNNKYTNFLTNLREQWNI